MVSRRLLELLSMVGDGCVLLSEYDSRLKIEKKMSG